MSVPSMSPDVPSAGACECRVSACEAGAKHMAAETTAATSLSREGLFIVRSSALAYPPKQAAKPTPRPEPIAPSNSISHASDEKALNGCRNLRCVRAIPGSTVKYFDECVAALPGGTKPSLRQLQNRIVDAFYSAAGFQLA